MCGIAGFTGKIDNNEKIIKLMADKIIHRGPDSEGYFINENIAFGFRRLSIIDLENGNQPIYNEDSSIVIVFNGEIYNHKELREDLVMKNHIFKSNSDTEVLVHLYEEYGTDMLNMLRGMFAFAIYDSNIDQLFLSRDFFGIKPLYYSFINDNIIFGSEIKSILEHPNYKKELNIEAFENYLTFQYSVLEESFFKGIFKLMPGHYILFKDGKLKIERYFNPEFNPENISFDETVQKIRSVISQSLEYHKESDVEIGSFLSSGVDSSYIASTFGGTKTFTVGFDYKEYNEINYAKNLSDKIGVTNYNKTITKEEYWDSVADVQYYMDEPLADPSAIGLYFVSKLAKDYVKVSFSGEGADEFFGGYNIYKEPISIRHITSFPMPIRNFLGKVARSLPFKIKGKNFFIRGSKTVEQRFIGNANIFSKKERDLILKNPKVKYDATEVLKSTYDKIKEYDDITKMQYIDIHFWLIGDILLKADKMSMANSIELRVPFLDKEVFKLASTIPTKYRVNKKETKIAFREAAKKYLPEEVSNKKKLGFPVPIRVWLKEDKYYNIVKEEFLSDVAESYFNTSQIIRLLDNHKKGKTDTSRKIWTIYTFLVWHKQYFN